MSSKYVNWQRPEIVVNAKGVLTLQLSSAWRPTQ
jgi:hypothetical protein